MVAKNLLLALLALAPSALAQDGSCDVTPTAVEEPLYDLGEGVSVDIVSVTGTEVKFTVDQVWSDEKLCLVATHYNSDSGLVCPMSNNVGPGEIAEYTAICVDGKTTITVYAYDVEFYDNADTSFDIESECSLDVEKIKTYEYVYEVECVEPGEEEVCQAISCAYVDAITYDFSSAADKEAWLFADDGAAPYLHLEKDRMEVVKTFDIPADSDFAMYSFTVMPAPGTTLPAEQELMARVGPYYFDLSERLSMLGMTSPAPSTDYFGQETVVTTKDEAEGSLTFEVKIPKELYEEKGRLVLGVRVDDGPGAIIVDDISVVLECPSSSTKDPEFDDGTSAGGGGGDPHFQRWDRAHSSFHGECDLVMVHSDEFHESTGLDLHVRTKIEDYFSYIETAALRIGETIVEFHKEHFFLNGQRLKKADLPITFGDEYKYTISNSPVEGKDEAYYMTYKVELDAKSSMLLKFYKKYLTINVAGHARDFSDSNGLLGEFGTGEMIGRGGQIVNDFDDFGFEWQVNPSDRKIFLEDRAPQLPYERCRMPTAARPSRRHLRGDNVLFESAQKACAHVRGSDFDLCTDDIMTTGDMGLADLW